MPDPFRHLRSPLAAASAALLLGGCVVGPNYKGPPTVAPAAAASGAFHRAGDASPAQPAARWWAALGDPQLDALIDQALAASPDLEAARARLRQSRAGLKQSRANLMPSTEASALYLTPSTSPPCSAAAAAAAGLDLYDTGFDATWEIDLFGGERRAVEGASAQAQALQADLEDAQVSLEAEVARAYVSLRDLQQRLANARSTAELETQMLALAKVRRAGGTASDLDVEQLQNQLESTRANLIPLQAQITDQLDRLAVLTGREPGALDAELSAPAAVPAPPASVAVGDPAALLRRRPDIRAAERRLAQQNALIGQRTADLFPKVQLLGRSDSPRPTWASCSHRTAFPTSAARSCSGARSTSAARAPRSTRRRPRATRRAPTTARRVLAALEEPRRRCRATAASGRAWSASSAWPPRRTGRAS